MFKINIRRWIAREITGTQLALLRAEDELLNAQMRVRALKARLIRLQARQDSDERQARENAAAAPVPELAGLAHWAYTLPMPRRRPRHVVLGDEA